MPSAYGVQLAGDSDGSYRDRKKHSNYDRRTTACVYCMLRRTSNTCNALDGPSRWCCLGTKDSECSYGESPKHGLYANSRHIQHDAQSYHRHCMKRLHTLRSRIGRFVVHDFHTHCSTLLELWQSPRTCSKREISEWWTFVQVFIAIGLLDKCFESQFSCDTLQRSQHV